MLFWVFILFTPIMVGPPILLLLASRTVAGTRENIDEPTMQRRRIQFRWGFLLVIALTLVWYAVLAWWIYSGLRNL